MLTGGGSAGHVSVNLALIPRLQEEGWETRYIGSKTGIEKDLISQLDIPYDTVSTGKLRRYFDWQNFKDPFKVMGGVIQAMRLIRREQPEIIFSKGGFVSVPVVIGAWLNRVPVMIHESDLTPGLANKLAMPFATKICTTFPETKEYIKSEKTEYVGAVVRETLKAGDPAKGRKLCGFTKQKPVLLIMGGSLGAKQINETIRHNLDHLLNHYQIVHLCGKGQVDETINKPGYIQFEYLNEALPDVLTMTDLVVSRAGSNSIFEFLALKIPMLLIPLSRQASRGDQILNARSFERLGYAKVMEEEAITDDTFVKAVDQLYTARQQYISNMTHDNAEEPASRIVRLIHELANAG